MHRASAPFRVRRKTTAPAVTLRFWLGVIRAQMLALVAKENASPLALTRRCGTGS
jgi:hypothetical protein